VEGTCEYGNELSDYIHFGEFLGQLKTFDLLKKDPIPLIYLCFFAAYFLYVVHLYRRVTYRQYVTSITMRSTAVDNGVCDVTFFISVPVLTFKRRSADRFT
jgi:hypothetical protein